MRLFNVDFNIANGQLLANGQPATLIQAKLYHDFVFDYLSAERRLFS